MALAQLARQYLAAFYAPPIALVAVLNAQGVMHLVGARLGASAEQLARASLFDQGAARAARDPFHATRAASILKRNPFDSVAGPLDGAPRSDAPAAPGEDVASADPWSAPACEGVRVSAIAASSDADWSFAALQIGSEETRLRRRGDEIGGKTLRYVGSDRVWLTSGARLCQATIFAPPPPTPAPPPRPADPSVNKAAGALDPALRKGIVKVSPTEFDVDRGVLEKILGNQAEFAGGIRAMPEMQNGKVAGMRVGGVRPDSLGDAIGLANGDLIQSVNGFDITDPEKALEAYARLRTADHLTVHVDRKGAGTNLDYRIR